jgi:CDP-diacylglycerol--glycerol-3-phosphate 3-phosphatidyltransferase
MNLPNKITIARIVLSVLLLVMLIFPFYRIGYEFPTYVIANGKVILNLKYIIGGILFLIASLTDFLDGYLARKNNQVTDFGKVLDSIADKMLVNGILIILAVESQISVIVPVVIVVRDIAVDSIKMIAGQKNGAVAASWTGKIKTACMLTGLTLLFFGNLPFELVNLRVAEFLILAATVLSVVSGVQYYQNNKKYLFSKDLQ